MKRLNEKILARYHDGELKDSERARVEELLASSPEQRRALEQMARLGDALRSHSEEEVSKVSFDGFEARVVNSLKKDDGASAFDRIRVWWSEFIEHRKTIWIPATSLVGAAAAVLLALPLLTSAPAPMPQQLSPSGGLWQAAAGEPAAPGGSEVMIVNRGQATGFEYNVLNDRGESIGVAWIND